MTFHRKRISTQLIYCIDNVKLTRITQIKDLGILFTEKLSFISHIYCIAVNACMLSCLVSWIWKEFRDPYLLKSVYCQITKSILEYWIQMANGACVKDWINSKTFFLVASLGIYIGIGIRPFVFLKKACSGFGILHDGLSISFVDINVVGHINSSHWTA